MARSALPMAIPLPTLLSLAPMRPAPGFADAPVPTREFEIRGDRAFLGGREVDLWGLRCGNALHSWTVTERHVRALDTMAAHGINLVGCYIQGSNGGWPDPDAGLNGFGRDGRLKPDVARRVEWLVRETDRRGMVVMVGLFSPRKDQELEGEEAVRRAVEEAGRFLDERKLRNVFVDLAHEFDHTARMDQPLFREPGGTEKKAKLAGWFKAAAPGIEVGVRPYEKSETADTYPGMDVRIIQKEMEIPPRASSSTSSRRSRTATRTTGCSTRGISCIDAVPTDCRQVDRVEAVQAEGRPGAVDAQALVARAHRDRIGPQQRGQQVTLGVAESRPVEEDLRGRAGHRAQGSPCRFLGTFRRVHGGWGSSRLCIRPEDR